MRIEVGTTGDVALFEVEGVYSKEDRPKPSLGDLVKDRLISGFRKILVDLGKADIVSDVGIGDILAAYVSTMDAGGRIAVVIGTPKTKNLFKITMLNRVLEIHDSVPSALAALTEKSPM